MTSSVNCKLTLSDESGPQVINLLYAQLNSAEQGIFSVNKYENYCWHFHIYWQRKFHAQLCLARKNLQVLVF